MGSSMHAHEHITVNTLLLIHIGSSEDFKNILDILNTDEQNASLCWKDNPPAMFYNDSAHVIYIFNLLHYNFF